MTRQKLKDILCMDDEFLDILNNLKETRYCGMSLFFEIKKDRCIDMHVDDDIDKVLDTIVDTIMQPSDMTEESYAEMLVKVTKLFFLNLNILSYIWEPVGEGSDKIIVDGVECELSYCAEEGTGNATNANDYIIFKVLPQTAYFTTSIYLRLQNKDENIYYRPIEVRAVVNIDSLKPTNYFKNVHFYFHDTKGGTKDKSLKINIKDITLKKILKIMSEVSILE